MMQRNRGGKASSARHGVASVRVGMLGLVVALVAGVVGVVVASSAALAAPSPAPASSSQLVTVNAASAGSSYATLSAWQRNAAGVWSRVFGPVDARVGGAGIGAAHEGSDLTPAGTYPLDQAFGRQPNPGTRLPYFQTGWNDWWDENPASPTYNLHVVQPNSPGAASENLYGSGRAYDYAVNISYNPARIAGAGSAFFLHVNTGESTAGCVSIDVGTLTSIMRWLDPVQHPYIDMRVGAAWTPTQPAPAPSPKPVMTLGAAQHFVNGVYEGLLHRPAGADQPWSAALAAGRLSKAQVATAVATSQERLVRVVNNLFQTCLGRPVGFSSPWIAALRTGTLAGVQAGICGSPEAWWHARGNVVVWATRAGTALLGAAPTLPQAVAWATQAMRISIYAQTSAMASSAVITHAEVNSLYRAMLQRGADPVGLAGFAPAMPGRGLVSVAAAIAGSAEFDRLW